MNLSFSFYKELLLSFHKADKGIEWKYWNRTRFRLILGIFLSVCCHKRSGNDLFADHFVASPSPLRSFMVAPHDPLHRPHPISTHLVVLRTLVMPMSWYFSWREVLRIAKAGKNKSLLRAYYVTDVFQKILCYILSTMLCGENEDFKAWRSYLPEVTSLGRWRAGLQNLSSCLILVTPQPVGLSACVRSLWKGSPC